MHIDLNGLDYFRFLTKVRKKVMKLILNISALVLLGFQIVSPALAGSAERNREAFSILITAAGQTENVSTLLVDMLTTTDKNTTYLAVTENNCTFLEKGSEKLKCTLTISNSDRKVDYSPKDEMTESSTTISYSVDLKTRSIIGPVTFTHAG
jgi:hypothetical protein